jgi:hypothetical protein
MSEGPEPTLFQFKLSSLLLVTAAMGVILAVWRSIDWPLVTLAGIIVFGWYIGIAILIKLIERL